MPSWGKKDGEDIWESTTGIKYSCTSGDDYIDFDSDVLSSHPDLAVGDALTLDASAVDGGPFHHRITNIADNGTRVHVSPAVSHTADSGTQTNRTVEFHQKPRYVSASDLGNVVGVDTTEQAALPIWTGSPPLQGAGLTHAGWVQKHTKVRDGVTYTWYETLVAMNTISEDTITGDVAPAVGT